MPSISMFYGIVIYLYFYDDERHKQPHIHAKFQSDEASFSIPDGLSLQEAFHRPKPNLFKRGSKFIVNL